MCKLNKCRYCFPKNSLDGWVCTNEEKKCEDKENVVSKEICEECKFFKSRYIEYPLTVNDIKNVEIINNSKCSLCEIQPCDEQYEGKSFIGVYLGELPISIGTSYNNETGILTNYPVNNPAIFVPELNQIIYGCESFWRKIDKVEDFFGITQEEIDNTWYVKLLREMR